MMKEIFVTLLCFCLPIPLWAGPEDWSFVQSVGGISIGTPVYTTQGWILPINVNVSGLETHGVKPTTINSALVCNDTKVTVEDKSLFLTIVTGLMRPNSEVRCPRARLGQIPFGHYKVIYRSPSGSPVQIGDVNISPG